jgi:hypothetical protein
MKFINSKQLAYILDIKKEDARAKMCIAYSKANNVANDAVRDKKGKIVDSFPLAMETEMLARELNIPTLQQAIEDIRDNYLKRPAYKKWILCDYPEKQLKRCEESGKPLKIPFPSGLRSLLSDSDVNTIKGEWRDRYKRAAC